jgi:hypothetical protein
MTVSENVLAVLTSVADNRRAGDVYASLDEVESYSLAACDYLNKIADRTELLRTRLSQILTANKVDELLEGMDDGAPRLYDRPEVETHLAVLWDALDTP